jgi:diphosphomevalonate decarboxylase
VTASASATARASANIALAKYWGKSDVALNLPAVPSISLTLAEMYTETSVTLDPSLTTDVFELNGREAGPKELARVTTMLDRVRHMARSDVRARVASSNSFPTASGLASSASGFAALAGASTRAFGVKTSLARVSALARASSASAARSVYGGFVELAAGTKGRGSLAAKPLHDREHWDVCLVVAVMDEGPKEVGSTDGMEGSRKTSPLYDAWVAAAPKLTRTVKRALAARDLDRLGPAMEQSTIAFHSVAMTSLPAIVYWKPPTLAAMATVRALRAKGVSAYATMDAGPHVKVLCAAKDARRVRDALAKTEGVLRTMIAHPGPGLEVRDS